jgi:hypothetical protein
MSDLSKASANTKENRSELQTTWKRPIILKFEFLEIDIPKREMDERIDTIA